MEIAIWITSVILFVLGLLVRKYPNLIAGYNTMTAEQKKKVDIKGLSSFMCRSLCVISSAYGFILLCNGDDVARREGCINHIDYADTHYRSDLCGGKGSAL